MLEAFALEQALLRGDAVAQSLRLRITTRSFPNVTILPLPLPLVFVLRLCLIFISIFSSHALIGCTLYLASLVF